VTNKDTIELLKLQVVSALAAGDADVRQKIMGVVNAYGSAMVECEERRAYTEGEALLKDWRCFLVDHEGHLGPNQRFLAWGRFSSSAAYFWELKAQSDYFLEQDYIGSPILYERAESLHAEALEYLEKVEIDPAAPAEFLQQRQQTLANQRADAMIARGMKLLTQGEFEVETGSLARGQELLRQAIQELRAGESAAAGPSIAAGVPGHPSSPSFIDYAEAILWRAKSDQALVEGDLQAAAAGEEKRAEALERCRAMHSRFGNQVNEYFARRMARDAHVARQRHDRFASAAAAQPRFGWLKSTVFLVAATAIPGLFVFWAKPSAIEGFAGLGLLLLYALVVAGIGSRLTTWREGAGVFADQFAKVAKGDKDKHK
jgi:hypothetical protein